jgi:hypothetical protein
MTGFIFALEGLSGFRVEFLDGDTGSVSTIIFHQPDGIFQAQREAD